VYDIPHEPYTLPEEIESKCFELVRQLGLNFGCIDMILTPDNHYVFLDINPTAAQWLWVEQLTGLSISEAMADLLITRDGLVNLQPEQQLSAQRALA
jgi:glutathione synthase/RimK-type ligase-like ATP-grasp enzyme